VKKEVLHGLNNNFKPNISKKEQIATKTLLNDVTVVIRPADKGSGVVIVDTNTYITMEKEMETGDSYEITDCGGQCNAEKAVKKTANRLYKDGHICHQLRDYLILKHHTEAKLKGNPKIHHKEGNPFRTIVNGIGTATENMAGGAEKELNEFVKSSPSYIRDTSDFQQKLQEIPQPLPNEAILFCFDVVRLYPSIPKDEGIAACKEALAHRTDHSIPSDAIIEMITTVLENNIIAFHGKEYRQTKGVAIGSRLGRNFACCYMRK